MRKLLIALVALLALSACERTEVNGITSRTGSEEFPPQLDLESFSGCDVGALGWVRGDGIIVNNSPETATYEVVIGFTDGDGVRIDQATTWIRDLRSGDRASFQAGKLLGDRAPGVSDCDVIAINRG